MKVFLLDFLLDFEAPFLNVLFFLSLSPGRSPSPSLSILDFARSTSIPTGIAPGPSDVSLIGFSLFSLFFPFFFFFLCEDGDLITVTDSVDVSHALEHSNVLRITVFGNPLAFFAPFYGHSLTDFLLYAVPQTRMSSILPMTWQRS